MRTAQQRVSYGNLKKMRAFLTGEGVREERMQARKYIVCVCGKNLSFAGCCAERAG